MSPFTVTVGAMSGPLEAVLEMVEKRKLFVNDVGLAQITDEYVAFVQNSPAIPLEERVGFVAIASALLLLKARSLLPSFTFTRDEELQVSGLRRDLDRYAYFRKIARGLEKVWGIAYVPEQKREGRKVIMQLHRESREGSVFAPGIDVTRERLTFAIHGLLTGLPAFVKPLHTQTVRSIKSIEQVVVEIVERLSRAMKTSFKESIRNSPKEEVVVYFLAMLELVKRGVIDAEQSGSSSNVDDILMSKVGGNVMHIS
jgi:segregation and condensation protein A